MRLLMLRQLPTAHDRPPTAWTFLTNYTDIRREKDENEAQDKAETAHQLPDKLSIRKKAFVICVAIVVYPIMLVAIIYISENVGENGS